MDNNLPLAKKFFVDNNWNLKEVINAEWTKHSKYNEYYLGANKNEAGECINCNGVRIYAGYVMIAAFRQDGNPELPFIEITKYRFDIISEWPDFR